MTGEQSEVYPHEVALAEVLDTGRKAHVERQHARGKRTARERIDLLCDASTFLEIGALARPEGHQSSLRTRSLSGLLKSMAGLLS